MDDRNIQVANSPNVDEIDKAKINLSLNKCYDTLYGIVNNKMLLKVHFKEDEATGARKKHSVNLHLSIPGVEVTAVGLGWNLITALQEAIETLERETIKKVKS